MSAKITRLRIAGFKSFADPATIDILPGLTGIVGPNGCGKSNVVEALRWAMGESSARALRGGELDDLIFAGTSARSARSLAEVTLWLEEATGLAPPPFADSDALEICRRAERGSGSDFRLNGRPLRARDITTLFADLSSGARSSSIVSQNRVAALISAKPEERRSLLEEAAGITGLHARRHDAELKLRQAEGNMERSEDLRQQIEIRLEQLETQSAQARAYRGLSETIRDDEAALAWLLLRRAEQSVERTAAQLHAAEAERDESAASARQAEQEGTSQKNRILSLREQVETLREARDKKRVSTETTREALTQARNASEQSAQHLNQLEADQVLALSRLEETRSRQEVLTTAITALDSQLSDLPGKHVELSALARSSTEALSAAEEKRQALTDRLVTQRLAAQSLQTEHESLTHRIATLELQEKQLATALAEINAKLPDETTLHSLQSVLDSKRHQRKDAEAELMTLTRAHQEARMATSQAEQEVSRASAEAERTRDALERLNLRLQSLGTQCIAHEAELASLAEASLSEETLSAYDEKAQQLLAERDQARDAAEQTRLALNEHQHELSQIEAESQSLSRQRVILEREYAQAQDACARHENQIAGIASQWAELEAQNADPGQLNNARMAREATEARIASLHLQSETLSHDRHRTRQELETCEKERRDIEAKALALRARHEALVATQQTEALPSPLIDTLIIPPGLERAVASALDETLNASLDEVQERAWALLPPIEALPLPQPSLPLSSLLGFPPTLSRCLKAIGLVEDSATALALQNRLLPGQSLVSREGALWRWDGYRKAGNLTSNALNRVEQLASLRALNADIDALEKALLPLTQNVEALSQQEQAQTTQLTVLRETLQQEEAGLKTCRQSETALVSQQEQLSSQHDRLAQNRDEVIIQLNEMASRVATAREALASLAAEETIQTQKSAAQEKLTRSHLAAEQTMERVRHLEVACSDAQEKATRLRLQKESDATKARTLDAALAQAREDQAELESQQDRLNRVDHKAYLTTCQKALNTQRDALGALEARVVATRQIVDTLGKEIGTASKALQAQRDLRLSLTSRLSALTPQHQAVQKALAEAEKQRVHLAPVPDLSPLEREVREAQSNEANCRATDQKTREALRETEISLERITQEKEQLGLRLSENEALCSTLQDDLTRLQERLTQGEKGLSSKRDEETRLEMASVEEISALENAEDAFSSAASALAGIESALEALAETRRQAEARSASARENAIRLQERLTQACAQLEKLEDTRNTISQEGFDLPLTEQSETTLKRRLARNQKEREALGPVNLLAEEEYGEARTQSDHLAREHDELTSAIGRLRGSITMLKKEGRERLQAVFVEVDRHFQSLFARMFNGGKAHLGLVGSDDPLEAGLEIFAQPPGKKLSTLSLLSGGEQALTALSLIFATFRCQPAPLCILDEVDAPLDDANVERLCGLLRDMTEEAQTRFLIVTHHQLTMAHMDRLFGVTMQERGVSQVLSVDLSLATSFAETGSLAVAT
ncbi:AAA family ATPase [Asaia prunellae]|uniref:AAA family ATPase n=1 Tax=Asaia prunellae TaxID=610245 RepID=UPI00047037CF|nr:AAA family ATPase [Asaia prunellae]